MKVPTLALPMIDGWNTRHLIEAGIDHGFAIRVSRIARFARLFPAFSRVANPLSAETLV